MDDGDLSTGLRAFLSFIFQYKKEEVIMMLLGQSLMKDQEFEIERISSDLKRLKINPVFNFLGVRRGLSELEV